MGLFEWILGEEPNPISQMMNYENKGQFGEYLTEYAANKIDGYYNILQNLYLPTYNGKTTEIDLVLIHTIGIFVFESKNYGGWIFGSENQKYWIQCFPNKEKYRFYNPIMQNNTHINALVKETNISKEKFYSFIIFSKRCELKKVPENTSQFEIMKRDELIYRLKLINKEQRENVFTCKQVDEITKRLKIFTKVSDEIKQKHIENIKNN